MGVGASMPQTDSVGEAATDTSTVPIPICEFLTTLTFLPNGFLVSSTWY